MIETERVETKISKENGFRELVFSANEIKYCESKAGKFEHYAARFAAKEAFFKALGSGWLNGTAFNEIEITNDESGKPEIVLLGETASTIAEMPIGKISVSLSHLKSQLSNILVSHDKLYLISRSKTMDYLARSLIHYACCHKGSRKNHPLWRVRSSEWIQRCFHEYQQILHLLRLEGRGASEAKRMDRRVTGLQV